MPPVHLPPQHWPSAVHTPLSATHCLFEHDPSVHENVQHWLFVVHFEPGATQLPTDIPHCFIIGSQLPVQHSALVVHAAPPSLQSGLRRGSLPSVPPSSAAAPSGLDSLPHPVNT